MADWGWLLFVPPIATMLAAAYRVRQVKNDRNALEEEIDSQVQAISRAREVMAAREADLLVASTSPPEVSRVLGPRIGAQREYLISNLPVVDGVAATAHHGGNSESGPVR